MKKILGVIVIVLTAYVITVYCLIAGFVDISLSLNGGGVGHAIIGIIEIFFLPMIVGPIGIGGGLALINSED